MHGSNEIQSVNRPLTNQVDQSQDSSEIPGNLSNRTMEADNPGRTRVNPFKSLAMKIKSLFSRSGTQVTGQTDESRVDNLKDTARKQYKAFMEVMNRESSDADKIYQRDLLRSFLPTMQRLAKGSQKDFDAYKMLLSCALKKGLITQKMVTDQLNTKLASPSETLSLLKASVTVNKGRISAGDKIGFIAKEIKKNYESLLSVAKDKGLTRNKTFSNALNFKELTASQSDSLDALVKKCKDDLGVEGQKIIDTITNLKVLHAEYSEAVETQSLSISVSTDYAEKAFKLIDTNPEKTLNSLNLVINACKDIENRGITTQAGILNKTTENLISQLKSLPPDELSRLDPELTELNRAVSEEDKKNLTGKLVKKFSDNAVGDLKDSLEAYRPKTRQETKLQAGLLEKYERGADKITIRDLAKMGQLLGSGQKELLNRAVLAKFILKKGQIKTTEYMDVETKNRIKESIGRISNRKEFEENLVGQINKLPRKERRRLEPELTALNRMEPGEKRDSLRREIVEQFSKNAVNDLKTKIDKFRPKSVEERKFRDSFIEKYDKDTQNITIRDVAQLEQMLGRGVKGLVNRTILAKYTLGHGRIAMDDKNPDAYDDKTTLERIGSVLGSQFQKIEGKSGVESVIGDIETVEINSFKELQYLKNKLMKKIRDHLPATGDDKEINEWNQSILRRLEKDIFIVPDRLKFPMLEIHHKIGSGGSDTIIYDAGDHEEMRKKMTAKMIGAPNKEIRNLYKRIMGDDPNALVKAVNENPRLAFKCFRIGDLTGVEDFEAFEKEAGISKSLHHEHIIQTHFTMAEPPRVGVVMELCEKGDLSNVLKSDWNKKVKGEGGVESSVLKAPDEEKKYNPVTSTGVKNIVKDLLLGAFKGLHYMHGQGVVHRDMKPENILYTKDGTAKVCDFGISARIDSDHKGLTQKELLAQISEGKTEKNTARVGTSAYMPPEVCKDNYKAHPSQDMYSMAMTALATMYGGQEYIPGFDKTFNIEIKMSDPDMARDIINRALYGPKTDSNDKSENAERKGTIFDKTIEGQALRNFIMLGLSYDPDMRPTFPEAIKLFEDIGG